MSLSGCIWKKITFFQTQMTFFRSEIETMDSKTKRKLKTIYLILIR